LIVCCYIVQVLWYITILTSNHLSIRERHIWKICSKNLKCLWGQYLVRYQKFWKVWKIGPFPIKMFCQKISILCCDTQQIPIRYHKKKNLSSVLHWVTLHSSYITIFLITSTFCSPCLCLVDLLELWECNL
jgi:hypothetical protein